ncbi:hypothetical protein ACOMHN_027057 [Nucella lapillus]
MLGDGDAKTHTRIERADPYEGRPVMKLECINHKAKQLDFLKKIDITPSQSVIDSVERRDIQRVKDASRKSSVREKKRRKTIDEAKRAEAEARRRRDGDNYGAGKF